MTYGTRRFSAAFQILIYTLINYITMQTMVLLEFKIKLLVNDIIHLFCKLFGKITGDNVVHEPHYIKVMVHRKKNWNLCLILSIIVNIWLNHFFSSVNCGYVYNATWPQRRKHLEVSCRVIALVKQQVPSSLPLFHWLDIEITAMKRHSPVDLRHTEWTQI